LFEKSMPPVARPIGRHDHVVDERFHHGSKRNTDDDTDGEIDDVATHYERPEILEHWQSPAGWRASVLPSISIAADNVRLLRICGMTQD